MDAPVLIHVQILPMEEPSICKTKITPDLLTFHQEIVTNGRMNITSVHLQKGATSEKKLIINTKTATTDPRKIGTAVFTAS
jgi:hypothetical protein